MDPILSYVLVACLISWTFWSPLVYGKLRGIRTVPLSGLFYFLGGLGPIGSAALHMGSLQWAVDQYLDVFTVPYHLALLTGALGAVLVCGYLAMSLYTVYGGYPIVTIKDKEEQTATAFQPGYFVAILLFSIVIIALEEIGWRVYLLELLMTRHHDVITVSMLSGIIWTVWHLPLFIFSPPLYPGDVSRTTLLLSLSSYLCALTSMSYIMTIVSAAGARSVQSAVLLHSMFNAVIGAFNPKYLRLSVGIFAMLLLPFSMLLHYRYASDMHV